MKQKDFFEEIEKIKNKTTNKEVLHIYTDGACVPNPGRGAWGYIVFDNKDVMLKEKSGSNNLTTNNRMEYTAMLEVLKDYPHTEVVIYSDSMLLIQTVTSWMHKWSRNGWMKKGKFKQEEVKNLDIVMLLFKHYNPLYHKIKWVKGHDGIMGNEMVDDLCSRLLGSSISNYNNYSKKTYLRKHNSGSLNGRT